MEHVTFLGSTKREGLLGTGARSNAYTDFHHTVFHVHAPLVNTSFGEPSPMLPQVCNNTQGNPTVDCPRSLGVGSQACHIKANNLSIAIFPAHLAKYLMHGPQMWRDNRKSAGA